ncbi:hypothetical protein F5Y19DRAFT_157308 [Xylariaceae sp. FL1651]|nr:hypothetical protein F5Y19DRAFT_157308 [Xylariaceae sp. FL1651]
MSSTNPGSGQDNRLVPLATPRVIATPNRRATSVEPGSTRQPASARRNNVATPHARAAIRAMDQRRAALFTPGRARRRSVREQRETPRDLLRNLSRLLAPTSQVVSSSSSPDYPAGEGNSTLPLVAEDDEGDDDFPIERPRFSLPLGPEDDDDDMDLKPPRLSGLEDDNYTVQSIELPRRAISEMPLGRFDRSSLGSMRYSDYMGPDIQSDDMGIDAGFFPPPALDDSGEVVMDEPAVIERLDADEARRQTIGGDSIFGPIEIPDIGNESTFIMAPVESPVRDPTATGGLEDLDEETRPLDNVDDSDDVDDNVNEPMDIPDFEVEDEVEDDNNVNMAGETVMSPTASLAPNRGKKRKTGKRISRHGIEYPALPPNVVKRLATTLAKTAGSSKGKISPDTLEAIMQATDWFFEQLGDDLSAYAKHAGRKTIDESDMLTLMRRQRQTNATTTPFALAQRHLPRELLQELRMPTPAPSKGPRKRARQVNIEGEGEVT